MKHIPVVAFALFLAHTSLAQGGYEISITCKPFKNQYVYLGYYYGKVKALADSVLLDEKSTATFIKEQKLPGGIYFLVSPRKEILFDFLIDSDQQFSITADTANIPSGVEFSGSPDNSMFQSYSKHIAVLGKRINDAMGELRNAKSKSDSATLNSRIQTLNKEIQEYRESVEGKFPSSMLAALFRSMKEPVIPPAALHPGKKYDSLYAYQYYKSRYWEHITFTDDRLIRTPILEPKVEKYFKELVVPDPDSIKLEIDQMLSKSKKSKEMYRHLLTYFVQKYINPEYMGQDAVFVHLFEKYINNNPEVDWFTEKYSKHMSDRAYSLMANLIGQPAANLDMVDSTGKAIPLYSLKGPFTVICFWDPTCGHCKEVVPKVDSIYRKKWKNMGVQLYGVMVDGGKENWVKYIRDNNLDNWYHVYETAKQKEAVNAAGKPGYKQLYDVYQTPVLYLLDKDKRIIAKKLTYQQIDEVLTLKSKNTARK